MSTQLQLEGLGAGQSDKKKKTDGKRDGAAETEINIKAARGGNGQPQ